MNPELFKTGACSILLGDKHYSGFFSPQNNKLFKVTKLTKNHNEFVNMAKIRSITKYDKYFIIPDEELFEIKHGENFYEFLEKLTKHKGDNLLSKKPCLYGNYIDYGGEKDLHDSIIEMTGNTPSLIWTGTEKIIDFCKQIMRGLSALHAKKICHLDIKPENIMVSMPGPVFKIIDFGFSSLEPFDDFISNYRGTPGYFPKNHRINIETLPKIDANDFILQCGYYPLQQNRMLVYKIDTYCFGRTLLLLYNFFNTNTKPNCSCFNAIRMRQINKIITFCLEKDVYYRYTIDKIISLNIL